MDSRARTALGVLAIAALGALVYLPALRGGFVFDDHELIENGRLLRGPLSQIWWGTTSPDYWPLTYTVMWVGWRAFGSAPAGHHALNLALHVLAALLLWRALKRAGLGSGTAWLAGVLFAVHPVAVESVAWVSELKNTLSACLWLATILAWLRWLEGDRRARSRALLVSVFALALLAKISVVVLPVVLLGLAAVKRGRVTRTDLVDVAPLAALAILAAAGNVWFQHHNAMAGGWAPARTLADRVAGAGWALASYLERAFVPLRLALLYDPWPVRSGTAWFWAPLVLVAGLAAVAWSFRKRGARPVLLAAAYVAVCVAPVLGLVDMAFLKLSPVANHLQYLALMAPATLGAWAIARLRVNAPRAAAAAGALLVLALGWSTSSRASAFADDLTLWRAAARDAPRNVYARQAYANELLGAGDTAGAIAELRASAAAGTDPGLVASIQSSILLVEGREEDAVAQARVVLASTGDPALLSDAAWTLVETGHHEEAIAPFQALVRRMPGASEYAYRLSVALARADRPAEALEVLRAYCSSRPGHPRMEAALALMLVRSGRWAEARTRAALVAGVDAADPRAELQLRAWYAEATGTSTLAPNR